MLENWQAGLFLPRGGTDCSRISSRSTDNLRLNVKNFHFSLCKALHVVRCTRIIANMNETTNNTESNMTTTVRFGTDGGESHVYRNSALLTVVDGIVTRQCYGLEWRDENRPFDGWTPPGYGELWATVNGKWSSVSDAITIAGGGTKTTRIVNLTPHEINICGDKANTLIAPSGTVARVATTSKSVAKIDGIPTVVSITGDVTGIPDPVAGTWYLVSGMVLDSSNRDDLCAPGALIRNALGQPVGCEGLRVRFAPAVCCNCGRECPQSEHGADCPCGGVIV